MFKSIEVEKKKEKKLEKFKQNKKLEKFGLT